MARSLLGALVALLLVAVPAHGAGWTTPRALSDGAGSVSSVQLDFDANGNGVAVWLQEGELRLSTHAPGAEGWTPPQTLADAAQVSLAVDDATGAAVIAVAQSNLLIVFSRPDASSPFSTVQTLHDSDGPTLEPKVAAAGGAFRLLFIADGQVYTSARGVSGWSAPESLGSDQPRALSLAGTRTGEFFAAWAVTIGTAAGSELRAARIDGDAVSVGGVGGFSCPDARPVVVIGGGSGGVAHQRGENCDEGLDLTFFAGTWDVSPAPLSNAATSIPAAAPGPKGDAVIAFTSGGELRLALVDPQFVGRPLSLGLDATPQTPTVVADPQGSRVGVGWQQATGATVGLEYDGTGFAALGHSLPAAIGSGLTSVSTAYEGSTDNIVLGFSAPLTTGAPASAGFGVYDRTPPRQRPGSAFLVSVGPFTGPNGSAIAGTPLDFRSNLVDDWSGDANVLWDFGDGRGDLGANVQYAYGAEGTFAAKPTLVDGVGNRDELSPFDIRVTPAPAAPPSAHTPPAAPVPPVGPPGPIGPTGPTGPLVATRVITVPAATKAGATKVATAFVSVLKEAKATEVVKNRKFTAGKIKVPAKTGIKVEVVDPKGTIDKVVKALGGTGSPGGDKGTKGGGSKGGGKDLSGGKGGNVKEVVVASVAIPPAPEPTEKPVDVKLTKGGFKDLRALLASKPNLTPTTQALNLARATKNLVVRVTLQAPPVKLAPAPPSSDRGTSGKKPARKKKKPRKKPRFKVSKFVSVVKLGSLKL